MNVFLKYFWERVSSQSAGGGNVIMSGNVGIGTDNPVNKFDIVGGATRSGTHPTGRPLYVTGTFGADNNGVEFRHDNGTQGIGFGYNTIYATGSNADQNLGLEARGANGSLLFTTNGINRMGIDGNGGVTVTSLGSGLVKSTGGTLGIASGSDLPTGSNGYIQNQISANQSAGFRINGIADVNANNPFAVPNGYMSPGSMTIGDINTSYGGGSGWTSNTAGLLLETQANTEIAVHDYNNRLASLFYYQGDATDQLTIGRDMGWGGIGRTNFAGDNYAYFGPNSTWGAYLQVGGNGRVTTDASVTTTNGNLHLDSKDGGANAIYLNYYSQDNTYINPQGGNVGIGTTTPSQKLEVAGNVSVPGSQGYSIYDWAGNDVNWRIGMSDNNNVVGFSRALATSHVQYLTFANGAGQGFAVGDNVTHLSSFEVTSSGNNYEAYFRGNVGIGTAAPAAKLHVANSYPFVGGDDGMLKIKSVAITGAGGGNGTEAVSLQTSIDNRTDDYTISGYGGDIRHVLALQPQGGYVGVGTTGPAYKLDVSGDINTSTGYRIAGTAASGSYLRGNGSQFVSSGIQAGDLPGGSGNYIQNQTGGDQAAGFRITGNGIFNGGNVGIGTTSPSVLLAVGGPGTNVYGTNLWVENNEHVQGNETLAQGGRGRLRIGTAWGYIGLYAESSSTSVVNDLILGASSARVRIGPDGGNQRLSSNWNTKQAGEGEISSYNSGNTTPGTGYSFSTVSSGISAARYWGNNYDFGLAGFSYNDYDRSGGIIGGNYNAGAWTSLGYRASDGNLYGLYYTSVGAGAGFLPTNIRTGIGQGGVGDLMGSWTRGGVMGQVASGELFASYNLGNEYTSGFQADIVSLNDKRVAAYSVTSTELKIYADGEAKLNGNSVFIPFSKEYNELLKNNPNVTITPIGKSAQLYIQSITKDGFTVASDNPVNLSFTWIAVGNRIDANGKQTLPAGLANKNFDENMKGVMFDENNKERSGTPIWWDGQKIRFDQPPTPPAKPKPAPVAQHK